MNIDSLYSKFIASTGVTTDSRHCPAGSIFFALKGDHFNGNKYAKVALDAGCTFAVVDEKGLEDDRCILVDDALATLQQLANHHRRQLGTPVIGITGSNGKTTTKELLAAVLSKKFNIHYTQGNFNNHIGVPLTLLQLRKDHELAIIEMGANHLGEIGELCAIAEPNMGILTNIGKAHLEGFGGIEGVINTKKELYDFIRLRGGRLFVNGDDNLLMTLSQGVERLCYNSPDSTFEVSVADSIPALSLNVVSREGEGLIKTQMVGEYNCINIAAVMEVGHFFKISFEKMKEALEAYEPSNNRSQILETVRNRIILDAYNANPASMGVAIENFSKLQESSKIVILGAMKELGAYSIDEHQAIVSAIANDDFVKKIVVGKEFCALRDKPEEVLFFLTIDEAKQHLEDTPINSAIVLIKGSRSMRMESLVELL